MAADERGTDSDICSSDYDSFNPDTGMFLPLDEVVDCVKNRPDLAKKVRSSLRDKKLYLR